MDSKSNLLIAWALRDVTTDKPVGIRGQSAHMIKHPLGIVIGDLDFMSEERCFRPSVRALPEVSGMAEGRAFLLWGFRNFFHFIFIDWQEWLNHRFSISGIPSCLRWRIRNKMNCIRQAKLPDVMGWQIYCIKKRQQYQWGCSDNLYFSQKNQKRGLWQ